MPQIQDTNEGSGAPSGVDYTQTFDRAHLINKLNYTHFIEGSVLAVFVHEGMELERRLPILPLPCSGTELTCRWSAQAGAPPDLRAYRFRYLLVEDAASTLYVKAELLRKYRETLVFRLPPVCHPLGPTSSRRKVNPDISAEVFQKGIRCNGRVVDFSSTHLDIGLILTPPQSPYWINPDTPIYLVLVEHGEICYSGECVVETVWMSAGSPVYRLKADERPFHRYQPKKYRSKRVCLHPSPEVVFIHPLSLQTMACKVDDLAGLGFSISVGEADTDLFIGLILSDVRLEMAGERLATCKAQVVYRSDHSNPDECPTFRFGFAILDIGISDHTRLHRLVQQAADPKYYFNSHVTEQALWSFLFQTGFVYPKKYCALADQRERIQEVYRRLYQEQPSFARHFIYQSRGTILSHMAMLRAYPRAWLIHHFAARRASDKGVGLRVLEQLQQFINESHLLDAIHMDYVFCFYRPENKLPNLVFGKAAKFVNDPKKCSLDEFAYGHFQSAASMAEDPKDLPQGWTLSPAQGEDREIFNAFYQQKTGGLMTEALDLAGEGDGFDRLQREYREIGFQRERRLAALKQDGRLKVFFEISLSDFGLNLSGLTNCVRIFVIDRQSLEREMLIAAMNQLTKAFNVAEVPVLVFPVDATEVSPVSVERRYMLWIYDLRYTDRYFAFTNRFVRFSRTGEGT